MKIFKHSFLVILLITSLFGYAQNPHKVSINQWLVSEGITVKMPVASDDKDINGEAFTQKSLLKFEQFDISKLRPGVGENTKFSNGNWRIINGDEDNTVEIKSMKKLFKLHYLVCYIEAHRWTNAKFSIESSDMLEVYLNGESIGGIYSIEDETEVFEKDIKLEKRNHTIIIKVLNGIDKKKNTQISANIELGDPFSRDDLSISTNPELYMDITHVLEGPRIKSINVSADGQYYFAKFDEITAPEGKKKKWIEFYELNSNKLVQSFRNYDFQNIDLFIRIEQSTLFHIKFFIIPWKTIGCRCGII